MIRWAVVPLAAALALVGCGGSSAPPAPRAATTVTRRATVPITTPPPKPKTKPKPSPKPKPPPGSLPQTDQLPSSTTRVFHGEMAALWAGVQTNSLPRALPAFFPEGAYVQVKAIGDAQGDFTGRLLADYGLDLAAAHALLDGHPENVRLIGVQVPAGYAHWVDPGACYNRVGYYEVPNARVIYRQNGAVHSFGIASMISWRGVWYVVHLGAVLRSAAGGVVDDPSLGSGESAPSSTC